MNDTIHHRRPTDKKYRQAHTHTLHKNRNWKQRLLIVYDTLALVLVPRARGILDFNYLYSSISHAALYAASTTNTICSNSDMIFINRRFLSIFLRHFAFICFLQWKKEKKIKWKRLMQFKWPCMRLQVATTCANKLMNDSITIQAQTIWIFYIFAIEKVKMFLAYLHFLCTGLPTFGEIERILLQSAPSSPWIEAELI